jgi:hypothetical protein
MKAKKNTYRPGDICPTSGVYRLTNNKDASPEQSEIPLTKGERFQPCRNCKETIEWELVREAKLKKK